MMNSLISFRPVNTEDFPLLVKWRNTPHVLKYYGADAIRLSDFEKKYRPAIEGKEPVYRHIAEIEGQPFAQIQCYRVVDFPEFSKKIEAHHGISVDFFIGEPKYFGKDLGSLLLKSYLEQIAFEKFPLESECFICHENVNKKAIACLKSVGFSFVRNVIKEGRPCQLFSFKKQETELYAVIFSSERTEGNNGYAEMSVKMEELAKGQSGFVSIESVRSDNGFGITVSYWTSLEAIKTWKQNVEHQKAQDAGKSIWYKNYRVSICKVLREYGHNKNRLV